MTTCVFALFPISDKLCISYLIHAIFCSFFFLSGAGLIREGGLLRSLLPGDFRSRRQERPTHVLSLNATNWHTDKKLGPPAEQKGGGRQKPAERGWTQFLEKWTSSPAERSRHQSKRCSACNRRCAKSRERGGRAFTPKGKIAIQPPQRRTCRQTKAKQAGTGQNPGREKDRLSTNERQPFNLPRDGSQKITQRKRESDAIT